MLISTQLRQSVWNVVVKALSYDFPNMPVIFAFQGGTEPPSSYATINLLSSKQIGHAQTGTLVDAVDKLHFSSTYETEVQISFFGSQSGDAISTFVQNINNNPVVLEETRKNGLGFLRKSQVRNNPQKRDTVWVDSYNMLITFNCTIGSEQLIDVVEHVVFELQDDGTQIAVPPFPPAP